jgi:hypothetical protein
MTKRDGFFPALILCLVTLGLVAATGLMGFWWLFVVAAVALGLSVSCRSRRYLPPRDDDRRGVGRALPYRSRSYADRAAERYYTRRSTR